MVWILSAALIAGFYGGTAAVFLFPFSLPAVLFIERGRKRDLAALMLLVAAVFGYGRISSVSPRHDLQLAAHHAAAGRAVVLRGWICRYPEHRLGGVRFLLETSLDGRPVRFLVTGVGYGLAYGDSVEVSGKHRKAGAGRAKFLLSRRAAGYFRANRGGIRLLGSRAAGSSLIYWAGYLHEAVRRSIARGMGSRCGIPTALAIGERGMVGRRLKTVFAQLGITHLLALSGMHLGLIVAGVLALFRAVRFRNRFVLVLVLTLYVGVVGEIVSLYRAYVMAVLLLLAAHLDRPLRPLDALGTALFVMLLISPELVYSVGFQLSFAATFAVLLCLTRLRLDFKGSRVRKIAGAVVATIVVSTCVQLFLAPVQLHYFGGVSVCAPIATAVFFPAVALLLLGSALAVGVDAVLPPSSLLIFALLDILTSLFEQGLSWMSSMAPGLIALPKPNPVLYYGGLCMGWFARGRLWRLAAGITICVVSFWLG